MAAPTPGAAFLIMNEKTFSYCLKCQSINKVSVDKIKTNTPICGVCKAPIPMHNLVSDVDFSGLMKIISKSDLPVVVDFWAPWCGPCKAFGPTFEKTSNSFGGKVVFIKINTESNPEASARFNVRGIPTVAVFKNGLEANRLSGAVDYNSFKQWVQNYS